MSWPASRTRSESRCDVPPWRDSVRRGIRRPACPPRSGTAPTTAPATTNAGRDGVPPRCPSTASCRQSTVMAWTLFGVPPMAAPCPRRDSLAFWCTERGRASTAHPDDRPVGSDARPRHDLDGSAAVSGNYGII